MRRGALLWTHGPATQPTGRGRSDWGATGRGKKTNLRGANARHAGHKHFTHYGCRVSG